MTKPKPLSESERPRRFSGEAIRNFFVCPFCSASEGTGRELCVIAYRHRTVRVECGGCGGRFSFDAFQVANATQRLPRDGPEGRRRFVAFIANEIAGGVLVGALRDQGRSPEEIRAALAKHGISDT